jgi:surface-anchored protein
MIVVASAGFLRPTPASPILYTTGHADITPDVFQVTPGVFALRGVWNNSDEDLPGPEFIPAADVVAVGIYDPASTDPEVVARPSLRPGGSQWDFLGEAAGEPVYILPSGGVPRSVPYIGWGTENGTLYGHGFDHVRIVLASMVGPVGGNVSVYTTSANTPMFTAGGFPAGSLTLPLGFHTHYNIAFTRPGTYDLTFGFEGLAGVAGPIVMTGGGTYRFDIRVVPEPNIVIAVPSGQTRTQAEAGYPLLSGSTPVEKTGEGTLVLDVANTLSASLAVNAGTAVAADTHALGTATLAIAAGATLAIAPVVGATHAVQVADLGTIAGRFDVGTGRFALAASGDSPEAELRSLLIAGRAGGSWDGASGIMSSDAPGDGGTNGFAVGYRVTADHSATVAWASLGDADLDGEVTTADVNAILTSGLLNTGISGAVWQQGDFDYDGLVTTADLNALLTTGRLNSGGYLPTVPSSRAVVTGVPEPSTVVLIGLGLLTASTARPRPASGRGRPLHRRAVPSAAADAVRRSSRPTVPAATDRESPARPRSAGPAEPIRAG